MDHLRLVIGREPLPFPPNVSCLPGFESIADATGAEYGFAFRRDDEYWLHVHRVGAFVLRPGVPEATGVPDPGLDLASFRDAFFHSVAPWVLQRGPWECLHASAVLTGPGVVIFCGPSGRGKSTLARAWADRGAPGYGDDAVPYLIRDHHAMAANLPQRFRLREPAASSFPRFPENVWEPSDPAATEIRCSLASTLRPVRAACWLDPMRPYHERRPVLLSRVSPVQAFPLLLGAAHCMTMSDPQCNRKMVRNYLAFARAVPVFRLSLAAGLDRLPEVLDFLERHLPPDAPLA
jgi:hypothetical protein